MNTNRLTAGLLATMLLTGGCATSNHASHPSPATADQPVPVSLDLTGNDPAAQVTLHTILVPMADKPYPPKARWWDEYILTVANQSPSVLVVDSATVIDLLDHERRWGRDPDELADTSRANWKGYQKAGVPVSPNIPELAGLKFILLVPFAAEIGGVTAGAGLYGFVLTPLFYGVALNDAAKMRREFAERQLKLPLRLEPGQSVKGSLSFPMVPGPRRFVLQGENAGQPVEIVIPLTGLSTLHLKSAPPAPATSLQTLQLAAQSPNQIQTPAK